MAQHATAKRTAHGKARTLNRKRIRTTKCAPPRPLDDLRRDLGLAVEVTL
jgi:hypothetical protein